MCAAVFLAYGLHMMARSTSVRRAAEDRPHAGNIDDAAAAIPVVPYNVINNFSWSA